MCTVEKRGQVFVLTLTGDGEHRLSHSLIADIRSALARIREEALSAPRSSAALVTAAHGKFFSNGFDLAYAGAAPTSEARSLRLHSMVEAFIPLVADLMSLPMPTIAAVTGHAAAAGFVLALAHDYVVMRGDRGVLYMSEMELGLPYPPYFLEVMREKIKDLRLFKDIVLRSKKITAAEAAERGVVDLVKGSAEEATAAAVEMAEGFVKRKWNGRVYASIRRGVFQATCKAVGLEEETEEERRSLAVSRL